MNYRTFSFVVSFAIALASGAGVSQGQEEPAELTQARALYQKDVDFALRPIRDRYLSRLDSLKRSLGSRGDARGAVAVQDEIDIVKAATGEMAGAAGLVGTWKFVYSNGSTRRYSIAPDGTVTYDEDGGKPVTPAKVGKLTIKGPDMLLDFQDGAIERLKVSGKKLLSEYFSPKTQYPAGKPIFQGGGTIVPGHK